MALTLLPTCALTIKDASRASSMAMEALAGSAFRRSAQSETSYAWPPDAVERIRPTNASVLEVLLCKIENALPRPRKRTWAFASLSE